MENVKMIPECAICRCKIPNKGYTTISDNICCEDWGYVCIDCYNKLSYKSDVTEQFDKLFLQNDGWVFISARGICYDLLEGMCIGGRECTSDTLFIMLADCSYNVDEFFVGYLYGAFMLKDSDFRKEMEQNIRKLVNEYEMKEFGNKKPTKED